jgi:hypothetical protein
MKKFLFFICFLYLPACFINAQYWRLTGNPGTASGTNFVGTTDAVPLTFKVGLQKAGFLSLGSGGPTSFGYQALNIDIGVNNSAFGYQALWSNSNGSNNTAIGYQSLYYNSPSSEVPMLGTNDNTGVGFKSLFNNTTGPSNTAIGSQSLFQNIRGGSNTAIGYSALYSNQRGNYNTATGVSSLYRNTAGSANTANGYRALYANTSGSYNVAYGNRALQNNTTGSKNIAVGNNALFSNQAGVGMIAIGDSSLFTYNYSSDKFPAEYNIVAIGKWALTDNSSGDYNTALGALSLVKNTTGGHNTATGTNSLFYNTTGSNNTANGGNSLYTNTTGSNNTASGANCLNSNVSGSNNIANGVNALSNNTTGNSNVAVGANALFKSKSNSNNVAIGDSVLLNYNDNTFPDYMLGIGSKALLNNTTGFYNTAVGSNSLQTVTTGNSNTALGFRADVNSSARFNATAIGYNAIATADNQVMLGNILVTSVKAAGSFVIMSDGRFKKNMKENVPGLDFIRQLKPVTYNYDVNGINKFLGTQERKDTRSNIEQEAIARKEKKLYTGFVAQDVEKVAEKMGYDFSGVYKPQNDKDAYGLSYADFVVPLVKAVQELSRMNDKKDSTITNLESEIDDLKTMMLQLQQNFNSCSACAQSAVINQQSSAANKQQTLNLTSASLQQNIPNPFNHTTTISYVLPQNYSSAKIIVVDKAGKLLKEISVSGSGKGSLTIDASTLSSGAYHYSLYVNGKLVDTKQMEHIK